MKNVYFVEYYDNFANTYNLYYAPADTATPAGMERITRKQAERLAARERAARRNDPSFAYRADTYIWDLSTPAYIRQNEWIARDDNYSYLDRYNVHIIRKIPDCYKI